MLGRKYGSLVKIFGALAWFTSNSLGAVSSLPSAFVFILRPFFTCRVGLVSMIPAGDIIHGH